MILPEHLAKTKRCCGPPGSGRSIPDPDNAKRPNEPLREVTVCIGSSCMAWRWFEPAADTTSQVDRPAGEGWHRADYGVGWKRDVGPGRRGYCALGPIMAHNHAEDRSS